MNKKTIDRMKEHGYYFADESAVKEYLAWFNQKSTQ